MSKISAVYMILNLINRKCYIGSSNDVNSRLTHHKYQLKNNKHGNDYLQKSSNKHGEHNFEFIIFEECDDKDLLVNEQYWMDYYKSYEKNNGYNIKPTAENKIVSEYTKEKLRKANLGKKHKPESIIKMSGKNHPNYGKHLSDETKIKMSTSKKGTKYKPMSDETKKNLVRASGEQHGKSKKYEIISPDNIVFIIVGNLEGFCLEHNLNRGQMRAVATGKRKDHRGWTMKYLDKTN